MPRGADLAPVRRALSALAPAVDLVGLTDNHMGRPRVSPLAAIPQCLELGLGPVVHLSCRDRNALGLRQQVLGAAAMGAVGMLVVRGDAAPGERVGASMAPTEVLRLLPEWAAPRRLFRGAVVSPFADRRRELRLVERKVASGVDFLQTQMVFDLGRLDEFLHDLGQIVPSDTAVFVSVGILRSSRNLDFVRRAIPDCPVPEDLAQRIRQGEGVEVAALLAGEIAQRPGLRLHLVPLGAEPHAPRVIAAFDEALAGARA